MLIFLTGCASLDKKVIGEWEYPESSEIVTVLPDGKATLREKQDNGGYKLKEGSYQFEDNKIIFSFAGYQKPFIFSIVNDKLICTYPLVDPPPILKKKTSNQ